MKTRRLVWSIATAILLILIYLLAGINLGESEFLGPLYKECGYRNEGTLRTYGIPGTIVVIKQHHIDKHKYEVVFKELIKPEDKTHTCPDSNGIVISIFWCMATLVLVAFLPFTIIRAFKG